jgi:flagellar hook-basal body protein
MSFYTALTGLQAATAQLGVTSNNIANVATTGFKRSRADFGDIFATSPLQVATSTVGQGVAIKQITQEFSQGNIQFSANSLDLAITGDGFFPMKSADGLQDVYTRNGTFLLDNSFNVVNAAGQSLIAAGVDSSGKADLGNLSKLNIPRKTTGEAVQTSSISLGLNLPSDATVITKPFDRTDPTTYNKSQAVTVYDSGGNDYLATVYYAKTQVASATDPNSKWQTYTYIGDTRIKENLIQADTKGDKLYVNKYGQTLPESQIPPQDIARGVTQLVHLDDLNNPVDSKPAALPGQQIDSTINNELKSGLNVANTLLAQTPANVGGQTQLIDASTLVGTAGAIQLTLPPLAGANAQTPITVTLAPITLTGTETKLDIANLIASSISADATFKSSSGFPGRSVVDNGDGTVSVTFSKADDVNDVVNPTTGISAIPLITVTSGTGTQSATELYSKDSLAFELNIDGASSPKMIDLSSLLNAPSTQNVTGSDIAKEITNQINKTYGDERLFDFTQGDLTGLDLAKNQNTGNLMKLRLVNPAIVGDPGATLNIQFGQVDPTLTPPAPGSQSSVGSNGVITPASDGVVYFDDLSKVTRDQALGAIQSVITANANSSAPGHDRFSSLQAGYDAQLQTFTFKNTGTTSLQIYASEPNVSVAGLMGLTSSESLVDASTGSYGAKIIPNGSLINPTVDQRYGTVVSYDDASRRFTISSGTTGDTSSIQITSASANAFTLLGLTADIVNTSAMPLRGTTSEPATLTGGTIGLNLDNKFRVDATNNQFVVTVDNVTGLVQIPPKADYTIEAFRQELENRINSLADNFGRTVNGVKVEIKSNANGSKFFQISTGTTGNDSFLKVDGNAVWGLSGLPSVRGVTTQWQNPPQAKNPDGFPLYVSRDGNETTDPGTFSADETRDLWSPVFYNNGQLTFSNTGDLVSPNQQIDFKSTTVGGSGSTLKLSIDYLGSTQYSSPFSVKKQDQNGRPEGDLIGVDIADTGLVNASYSNGTTKALAKVILANFSAPTGLRQIGDTNWLATSKSGDVKYGEAGAAGFGTVRAGARERANVDLTTELVDLITAQRNFQANAKAIETNNTLTSAIINIRS